MLQSASGQNNLKEKKIKYRSRLELALIHWFIQCLSSCFCCWDGGRVTKEVAGITAPSKYYFIAVNNFNVKIAFSFSGKAKQDAN